MTNATVSWRQDYERQLADPDPAVRAAAAEQLDRLRLGARRQGRDRQLGGQPRPGPIRPYRQQLRTLVEQSGNPPMRWRGSNVFETSHQPFHTSKSGTCLLVDLERGHWWCRSCGSWGGAAEWLARWRGCSRLQALALLRQKVGDGAP